MFAGLFSAFSENDTDKKGGTLYISFGEDFALMDSSLSLSDSQMNKQGLTPGADTLQNYKKDAVKVYLDCNSCDQEFMKTDITFVNFVRDRNEAQVHILVTTQATASGGREYTITFIGKQEFESVNDTLKYVSKQADTDEMKRNGLSRLFKLGLIRYVSKTPLSDQIGVSFTMPLEPTSVIDKWNSWVFNLETNLYLSGQHSSKFLNMYSTISAQRVTPDWKLNFSYNNSYNVSAYTFEVTPDSEVTYYYYSRSNGFSTFAAKSLDDHWSAGFSTDIYTSTYSNTDLSLSIAPAIEYDLFPYSESTRRQLRFIYQLHVKNINYAERTIFDKTSELLVNEDLSVNLSLKEQWGTVSISLNGSNYLHDFSKYQLGIYGNVSLRLLEGLSLNVNGNFSKIRDQLALPRVGATDEDILLQRRELATQYRYWASIGFGYTFGSIFNNVVNPRFGN